MKNIFKKKYRIVTDAYLGYEVQEKNFFWPFWMQSRSVNTHRSIKDAKEWIKLINTTIVVEEL